ncbi:MAG: DUF1043 family protein [Deltaproteobacteria bacterium]|nr:DUF1043 family protein [Deltaproteobacteria bacterium]
MAVDPLLSPWLILIPSVALGAFLGIVFERTRGTAAKRAAKFEADLVEARSALMRYRDQTKHHFGKSAELLGKMATDYREFLDHFVTGAEELCGPNMKEIDASGLDQRLLGTSAPAPAAVAPGTAAPGAPLTSGATVPIKTVTPAPIKPATAAPIATAPAGIGTLATDPLAEDAGR